MAKGGNGEEMKVTAPGAKVGDKMNCDEKGTCTQQLMHRATRLPWEGAPDSHARRLSVIGW